MWIFPRDLLLSLALTQALCFQLTDAWNWGKYLNRPLQWGMSFFRPSSPPTIPPQKYPNTFNVNGHYGKHWPSREDYEQNYPHQGRFEGKQPSGNPFRHTPQGTQLHPSNAGTFDLYGHYEKYWPSPPHHKHRTGGKHHRGGKTSKHTPNGTKLNPSPPYETYCDTPYSGYSGYCVLSEQCNEPLHDLRKCESRGVCCPIRRECQKYPRKYNTNYNYVIYGGESTTRGLFPHMVAIFKTEPTHKNHICGGTIITSFFILTAAHCIHDRRPDLYEVVVGEFDLNSKNGDTFVKTYQVAQVDVHMNYSGDGYDDIGLLKTKEEIGFNRHVYPACLFTKSEISGVASVTICGWGETERTARTDDAKTHKELLKARVDLLDLNSCRTVFNEINTSKKFRHSLDYYYKNVTDSIICTMVEKGRNVGTCGGDSGGPLQFRDKFDTYFVIGIVSSGVSCPSDLSLFTRVSAFIPWIKNIVGELP